MRLVLGVIDPEVAGPGLVLAASFQCASGAAIECAAGQLKTAVVIADAVAVLLGCVSCRLCEQAEQRLWRTAPRGHAGTHQSAGC